MPPCASSCHLPALLELPQSDSAAVGQGCCCRYPPSQGIGRMEEGEKSLGCLKSSCKCFSHLLLSAKTGLPLWHSMSPLPALLPDTPNHSSCSSCPLFWGLQGFPFWRNLVHLSNRSLGQAPSQSHHLHVLVPWVLAGVGCQGQDWAVGGGRMLPIELTPPLEGFLGVKPPQECLYPPSGLTSLKVRCWVPATLSPYGTCSSWGN